ncbi:HIT-like protein [Gymnopus androsaceus JB14]|uniref:HIT-like protein n=1 Tax=Gymnopus androsaceus JB14 TaxID=1447944 RepID=A0A6A4GUL6_9AGAR|nr:HIT-like protein [Gymnopus androsaceus JB14]
MESPKEAEYSVLPQSHTDIIAVLSSRPTVHGQVSLMDQKGRSFSDLTVNEFVNFFLLAQKIAAQLKSALSVNRVAMASDGTVTNLIPLHGVAQDWKPVLNLEETFHPVYPGFFTSKTGPKMANTTLDEIQSRICAISGLKPPHSLSFKGDPSDTNLFARIVRGDLEQWRIWEDDNHVALLTPFANTPGYTILVPRAHLSSDIFHLGNSDYEALMRASYTVMEVLRKAFAVERVGVFFEGFEIDYTHVKLIPAHSGGDWKEGEDVPSTPFFEAYPGYITTQRGPPADDSSLKKLCNILRDKLTLI